MKCFFEHKWSWPRKRGEKDIQVCLNCGAEREALVRFDGPRYHRTQDGIPNFTPSPLQVATAHRRARVTEISPAAA